MVVFMSMVEGVPVVERCGGGVVRMHVKKLSGRIRTPNWPFGQLCSEVATRTMLGMGDFTLHRWFSEEGLEPCPACGAAAGVRLPESRSFVCLGCCHARTVEALPLPATATRPVISR
jgi:hypothetical protein